MDKFADKLADAERIIDEALRESKNPVCCFSAGKDSTVMLHILKFRLGVDLPVLFHREPWMHEKYLFGLALLAEWVCTAHDYNPSAVDMWAGENWMAWTNHYQIGTHGGVMVSMALPKNILAPEPGKPYLCGKVDIFQRPLGTFNYPWDLAFIGHKNTDEDQIAGKVPLKVDILRNGYGPKVAFPLRQWSDENVWAYLDANKIPVQENRYDRITRTELKSKRMSGDYFHACVACLDRRNPATVHCPKLNEVIPNISAQVTYRDCKLDYFTPDPV